MGPARQPQTHPDAGAPSAKPARRVAGPVRTGASPRYGFAPVSPRHGLASANAVIQMKPVPDPEKANWWKSNKHEDIPSQPTKALLRVQEDLYPHGIALEHERAKPDIHYAAMMAASSSGPRRSADVDYPERAETKLDMTNPFIKELDVDRKDFDASATNRLIEFLVKRNENLTKQDEKMIAEPGAGLQDAGIHRGHRLAYSSITALVKGIYGKIARGDDMAALKGPTVAFFSAFSDPELAAEAYDGLEDIARARRADASPGAWREASRKIEAIIFTLANSERNLRFVDAESNVKILHGFDANRRASGAMTPISGGITEGGMALSAAMPDLKPMILLGIRPSYPKNAPHDDQHALSSSRAVDIASPVSQSAAAAFQPVTFLGQSASGPGLFAPSAVRGHAPAAAGFVPANPPTSSSAAFSPSFRPGSLWSRRDEDRDDSSSGRDARSRSRSPDRRRATGDRSRSRSRSRDRDQGRRERDEGARDPRIAEIESELDHLRARPSIAPALSLEDQRRVADLEARLRRLRRRL